MEAPGAEVIKAKRNVQLGAATTQRQKQIVASDTPHMDQGEDPTMRGDQPEICKSSSGNKWTTVHGSQDDLHSWIWREHGFWRDMHQKARLYPAPPRGKLGVRGVTARHGFEARRS